MPTYEYVCDACEHQFEEFQGIKDEPLKKCPKCKKKQLRRLISAGAGLIFKGSGFYITDYRSESYKSAAKADEKAPDAPAAAKPGDATKTPDAAKSSEASKADSSGSAKPGSGKKAAKSSKSES